jgi:hypothetical protein
MATNGNPQGNQKEGSTSLPKGQAVRTQATTIPDRHESDKFPKWDILPPHQFINPRVKKTE